MREVAKSLVAPGRRLAATNELQFGDLRERRVDLILGRLTVPIIDEDLHAEILFEDSAFPIASANSKWAKKRRIDPAELVNEAWCFSDDSFLLSAIAKAFLTRNLGMPRRIMSTNSIQLHYEMAAAGRVIAMATGSRLRLIGKRMGLIALAGDFLVLTYPTGISENEVAARLLLAFVGGSWQCSRMSAIEGKPDGRCTRRDLMAGADKIRRCRTSPNA